MTNRRSTLYRVTFTGWLILTVAYALVFTVTSRSTGADSLITALINTLPLIPLTIAIAAVQAPLSRTHLAVQVPAQILLASLFAVIWYTMVIVLLGLRTGNLSVEFIVRPFRSQALAWQIMQGLTLYGLAAALGWTRLAFAQSKEETSQTASSTRKRLLVRSDEDLTPIDVDDIIAISRNGDFSEILVDHATHRVRRSLAAIETELPPEFVRVHRAHLINLNHLDRAEPIGAGRLRLLMSGGHTIDASRAGTQALRQQAS
ncbi:MAG: hypothetical protein DHS20C11_36190 [Lysobacteraceae bacterium]|nr:MAG: hypothetical protein DHS20C11_36190 [Xanthomonadaceae bacterium]